MKFKNFNELTDFMKRIIIMAALIVGAVVFVLFFINGIRADKVVQGDYQKEVQKEREKNAAQKKAEKKKQEALAKKAETSSFYQKLSLGLPVDILIIGDEIGTGAGASEEKKKWMNILADNLRAKYGVSLSIGNICLAGGGSYASFVKTSTLSNGVDYDLAILCMGANDKDSSQMQVYMEGIIRQLRNKYNRCSVMAIKQAAYEKSKLYLSKAKNLSKLCEYYDIPLVDTAAGFDADKEGYEALTSDGIRPKDAGYAIYAQMITEKITELVDADTGYDEKKRKAYNKKTNELKYCRYISSSEFTKLDETTYEISLFEYSGTLGLDYVYQKEDNYVAIYANGEEINTQKFTWDKDPQQHIELLEKKVKDVKKLTVAFTEPVQAAMFNGIIFTGKRPFT